MSPRQAQSRPHSTRAAVLKRPPLRAPPERRAVARSGGGGGGERASVRDARSHLPRHLPRRVDPRAERGAPSRAIGPTSFPPFPTTAHNARAQVDRAACARAVCNAPRPNAACACRGGSSFLLFSLSCFLRALSPLTLASRNHRGGVSLSSRRRHSGRLSPGVAPLLRRAVAAMVASGWESPQVSDPASSRRRRRRRARAARGRRGRRRRAERNPRVRRGHTLLLAPHLHSRRASSPLCGTP